MSSPHKAVYDGNTKHVKDLLMKDDTDITIPDELENVLLHIAVEKDNVEIVKLLTVYTRSNIVYRYTISEQMKVLLNI